MSNNEDKKTAPSLAIVGLGCLFPKANNPEEYWMNIREGVDAISDIPDSHWDPADYFDADEAAPDMTYTKRGGFISPQNFNPLLYGLSPNNIEATDTTQLLGMVVARQALLDAGYSTSKEAVDGRKFNRDRTSVIMGVTGTLELVIPLGARLGHPIWRKALADAGVDPETADDVVQRIADGYVPWQENSFPGLLGNVVAGRIANRFDLGGTNCVVDAACASSLGAIHLAALELSTGQIDMAITGGMDTFNDIFMYMCFSKTPALSPTGNSRPFAKEGDGTILGEGLGAIILKRLCDAKRDNDKIYAVLRGIGSASDGKGNAIYAPSANGQTKALWNAYKEANVSPRSIELVEAHGTGTVIGDAVEAQALSHVYREGNKGETWCAIGSVKSMIGHTKAAAGVAGLIKTALALKHKVLPPSIKVDEPLKIIKPGTAPIYLNTVKRPWIKTLATPRRAAISSFGFGGSNFHCVLEEAEATKTNIEWDGMVLIIALSATSKASLVKQLPRAAVLASWNDLRHFAYTSCRSFKQDAAHRLSIVIQKSQTDLQRLITDIENRLNDTGEDGADTTWQMPNGVSYSAKKMAHNIAFVFPGQGSQYIGMGRDLACQFPQFLAAFEEANQIFMDKSRPQSLVDLVYPIPVFSEVEKKEQETILRLTQNAQPAIGAVSIGSLAVLRHFGVEAAIAIGHSYGELSALAAAGYYLPKTLYYLSRLRGELMSKGKGDRGAMLAVLTSYEEVKTILNDNHIKLVIANHNSPKQVVLSGATKEIEQFLKLVKEKRPHSEKIRTIKLPVAAAFHSPAVATAVQPFAEALTNIQFSKNKLPVLSNTTADYYPTERNAVIKLLAAQLENPVCFVEQIKRLYADHIETFIEVGPGKTLTGLINAILADKPITALAMDPSSGKQQGQYDLALVLATLAANGNQVDLTKWDECCPQPETSAKDKKPAMTIAISGANYVMPRNPRPTATSTTVANQPMEKNHSVINNVKEVDTKSDYPKTVPATVLLKATQDSLLTLQKMQEQTARLHQQYLEGQETAQKSIQSLLAQQQQLMTGVSAAEPVQQHVETETTTQQNISQVEKVITPAIKELEETNPAEGIVDQSNVDINNLLLNVVSEKTGYPLEMLSLDMSLDTDLGIDSIKRVEIFSALQERLPWSATVNPEELGTFQFLQNIVEFIVTTNPAVTQLAKPSKIVTTADNDFEQVLLKIVSDKTGYPVAMLSLEMNLDSDLGIDSIKRVEILAAIQEQLPELPTVNPDDMATLQTLQQIIDYMNVNIDVKQTSLPVANNLNPNKTLKKGSGIIRQVVRASELQKATPRKQFSFNKEKEIWINKDGGTLAEQLSEILQADGYKTTLVDHNKKPDKALGGLILCPTSELDKKWLLDTFSLIQCCGPILKEAEGILASVTTLGGYFGFADDPLIGSPVQAGLHGIIKTAAKEWSTVHCKSIDMDPNTTSISSIKNELFFESPLEVGLCKGQILQLLLEEEPLAVRKERPTFLNNDDFIVISGGARGITAEVAVALAETYQCCLLLLGRSPEPQTEPEWLVSLSQPVAIKKAILEHTKEKLTPADLEKHYRSILANREIRTNLARIQQVGAKVQYRSVDVTNADAVANVIDMARIELGNVTGFIHAAGVLADRLIEDKTMEQFNAVYSTKVDGLKSLLSATDGDPLKLIVLFSSTTARFGRKGQVDYATANETLNKMAVQENQRRKNSKVLSVNWGPWNGGMVTPVLKKLFTEEGVEVIALKAGANYLIQEIESDGPVETVILGTSKGVFQTTSSDQTTLVAQHDNLSLVFKRDLSIDSHAFLKSHVMKRHAVLPVAVIIEWLAHGALHLNLGMQFHGFDNLRVLKGISLKGNQHIQLQILAGDIIQTGNTGLVPVELHSEGQLHASTVIVLTNTNEQHIAPKLQAITGNYRYQQGEYYQNGLLFHGQHLQGIKEVTHCSDNGIFANVHSAPMPTIWMKQPIRSSWLADPLILDSAFQMMILWSFEQKGIGSLPTAIAHYRQYQNYPKDGAKIVVAVNEQTDHQAKASIEFLDNNGQLIALMDGYECVRDGSLQIAFKENELEKEVVAPI